jgi:hypothetical protein
VVVGDVVAQEEPRGIVTRPGLTQLLSRSRSRRVLGHVEMQHASTFVREHDEDDQHPEGGGGAVKKSMAAICAT